MTKRIWDDFLTERDRRVYEAAGYGKRVGFGTRPALSALLPGKRGARVTINLRSGERRTAEVSGSRGDPGDALSAAEVEQKFRAQAIPAIGAERAATVLREAAGIERAPSIAPLLRALNDNARNP